MELCAAQEALRRYKDEVATDPDTESGFYYNTNAVNHTKQYVLVGILSPVHTLLSDNGLLSDCICLRSLVVYCTDRTWHLLSFSSTV